MISLDDLWKILNFLESGEELDPTLDKNLSVLAQSEKSKTSDYFEKILDVNAHLKKDYGRLRKFLIDWYASHKTLVSTQKQITDVFSLPEDSLSELIQSFGYLNSLNTLSFNTKTNFFLELVNLYKIKGTPLVLERVLEFFGLTNIEILEYWLQRNDLGDLTFRPLRVLSSFTDPSFISLTPPDIDFQETVDLDPHWMLTKKQIEASLVSNPIGVPSISPYFSINTYTNVAELKKFLTIFERKIQDEYQNWLVTKTTPKEITLKLFIESSVQSSISVVVSVLEVYLSAIYMYNTFRQATGIGRYNCYNGTETDIDIISALYDSLTSRTFTRAETQSKRQQFWSEFTRAAATNFLQTSYSCRDALQAINPSLRLELNNWISTRTKAYTILVYLLNELTEWCQQNISKYFPNLPLVIFGLDASPEIIKAINFFKPYRARLQTVSIINIQKNPSQDVVMFDDLLVEQIQEQIIDYDTADSYPGMDLDFVPTDEVTSTAPAGYRRITNLYVDDSSSVIAVSIDSTSTITTDIVCIPPVGCHRITNVYLQIPTTVELVVEYSSTPEAVGGISTPVLSNPPNNYIWPYNYLVYDISINPVGDLFISYNKTPFPFDQNYYSRNTYDTGSYFDIGASVDSPVRAVRLYVREGILDYYCGHPIDTTSYISWEYIFSGMDFETGFMDGGFMNVLDSGGLFDQPFPGDICYIYVQTVPSP